MGTTDQITFKDWYATTPSKPVVNLQVIAEAMTGFSAGGNGAARPESGGHHNFYAGLVGIRHRPRRQPDPDQLGADQRPDQL